jgi:hypothetical protein
MITVEMSFNALKVRFGGVTHLRIDATKLIGHQSWREGYGNRKFVIEYTTTAGQIVSEYDTEDKWREILAGLDRVLDGPNVAHGLNKEAGEQAPDNPRDPFAIP